MEGNFFRVDLLYTVYLNKASELCELLMVVSELGNGTV
jgi:hypothetical protein